MRFFVSICLMLALLAGALPAQTVQAAGVVNPTNMQGWVFVNDNGPAGGWGDFVQGPGTPLAGNGSARLVVQNSSAGWILARYGMHLGTRLSDITRLEYSTYVTTNVDVQAISLAFNIDLDVTDTNTAWQGRLVYEPYVNGSTVTKGIWQTWNAQPSSTKWWASTAAGPLAAACPQGPGCTMETILGLYPNIGIHPTMGGVVFKAGSGWATFEGNVDNFVIGVSGVNETFDFEPLSTVYVDDDWSAVPAGTDPDGSGPALMMGIDAFTSIQAGANAVPTGGTVEVAAGSYTEQVTLRGMQDVTINGAGEGLTTIVSPDTLANLYGDRKPVVGVENSENITIQNLTVDGDAMGTANIRMFGVFYHNASGLMDHLTVVDVRRDPLDGVQTGVGIYAFNDDGVEREITVSNSTATGYQKGGFVFNGVGLTAHVLNNTATGIGATPLIAMNGIQIGYGATGIIEGNTVSGHTYNGTGDPTATAAGILIFGSTATIRGNTIIDNQVGVSVSVDMYTNAVNPILSTAIVEHNRIVGNEYGVLNETYQADETAPVYESTVSAVDNWWSCNEGPNETGCDTAQGPITAPTWLVLSFTADANHVTFDNPMGLEASIHRNSAGADVSASGHFPEGEPVAFATTVGTLDPLQDALSSGLATSVLTVTEGQTLTAGTISAALDNETITLAIRAGLARYWMPAIYLQK